MMMANRRSKKASTQRHHLISKSFLIGILVYLIFLALSMHYMLVHLDPTLYKFLHENQRPDPITASHRPHPNETTTTISNGDTFQSKNGSHHEQRRVESGITTFAPQWNPLQSSTTARGAGVDGLIRSFPHPDGHHDPKQRRTCLTLTAVPSEVTALAKLVTRVVQDQYYAAAFQCIHISIPDRPMRLSDSWLVVQQMRMRNPNYRRSALEGNNSEPKWVFEEHYPPTKQLLELFNDPRIILHRLFDYGPMTRYIGALAYEQHPDTDLVLLDVDSAYEGGLFKAESQLDVVQLVHASRHIDADAVWCHQGENFRLESVVESDPNRDHDDATAATKRAVVPAWDTFPTESIPLNITVFATSDRNHRDQQTGNQRDNGNAAASSTSTLIYRWNRVHFCRGVSGLLFHPKHFADFWYNQSEYHESCFWDDDRWVSFQVDRQGYDLKVLHHNIRIGAGRSRLFSSDYGRGGANGNETVADDALLTTSLKKEHPSFLSNAMIGNVVVIRRNIETMAVDHANRSTTGRGGSVDSYLPPHLNRSKMDSKRNNHRRLGTLTALTDALESDQTCTLAWMDHHPDAYPTARVDPSRDTTKMLQKKINYGNNIHAVAVQQQKHLRRKEDIWDGFSDDMIRELQRLAMMTSRHGNTTGSTITSRDNDPFQATIRRYHENLADMKHMNVSLLD